MKNDINKRSLLRIVAVSNAIIVLISVVLAGNTPLALACHIDASVTSSVNLVRSYDWSITKTVAPVSWDLYPGDLGASTYTVAVAKSAPSDVYVVSGDVTVTNALDRKTNGLTVDVYVQRKKGSAVDTTYHQVIKPTVQLNNGQTGTYHYEIQLPLSYYQQGAAFKVYAAITDTSYSTSANTNNLNMPTTPGTVNYCSITVDDSNGQSWTFSDSGSQTYAKTFLSPRDAGQNVNTATIRGLGKSASATVTVNVLDQPTRTVQFKQADYPISEDAGTVTLTVTMSNAATVPVTFNYQTVADTAAAGTDFTSVSSSLTFSPGETQKTITVDVMNDGAYSTPDKLFYVQITGVSGPAGVGTPSQAKVTLLEASDKPMVSFKQASYTAGENDGNAVVTVTLSAKSAAPVVVHYQTWPGSAYSGVNYVGTDDGTITFPAGSTTDQQILVPIMDDHRVAGNLDFTVILDTVSGNAQLAMPNSARVTILDGDVLSTVKFSQASYTVAENGGNAVLTVTSSARSDVPVVVHYETWPGSAYPGENYVGTDDGTITFPAGSNADQQILVPILDNSRYTGNRDFTVILDSVSDNAQLAMPNSARVTILEDEKPQVSFKQSAYSVGESDGTATLDVSLDNAMPGDVVVHYKTTSLTAVDGTNFAGTSDGTITFPAGSNADQQIQVPVLKDDKYSGDPQFKVELLSVSSGNAVIGTPGAATVTIDEALPNVQFDQASYSVKEDAGKATLVFSLSEPSTIDAKVYYSTGDGSARSPDDYTGTTSGIIVVLAGKQSGSIDVPIIADPYYESDETFGVILNGVAINGASRAATGSLRSAGVTIVEDDPLVSLGATAYNVAEDAGKVSIGLTLSHASSHDITVNLGAGGGNATRGADYEFDDSPLSVVIPAGQTSKTVDIPILDDSVHENDEYFNLGIGQAFYAGLGTPTSATVTIQDDEKPTVQFEQSSYMVSEDAGSVTIDVTMGWKVAAPVIVNYQLKEGTAVPGEDYSPDSGSLFIPAGETSGTITVTVKNDGKYSSPDEYFTAVITGVMGPATVGTPSEAIVTINEGSPQPAVQFKQASYTVSEDGANAVLDVTMSSPSTDDVQVSYATGPGTAKDGINYTGTMDGLVTIPAGSTDAQIEVPIVDDNIYGGNTFFFVTLTDASPDVVIGSQGTAKVTIQEDEIQYILNLPAGQSIISFPIVIQPFMASTLEKYGISSVTWFDNKADKYNTYLMGISPTSLDFLMSTDNGYIVYCDRPTSIVLTGKTAVNRKIELNVGQTIIGWSSLTYTSDSVTMADALTGSQSITRYDNPTDKYYTYLEDISLKVAPYKFTMQAGEGYIIYTDTPLTINYGGNAV